MSTTTLDSTTAPAEPLVRKLIDANFGREDGVLLVGGCAIGELAATYGTPLFVYDQSIVARQLDRLRSCFGPRVDVYYSMKANPAQELLRFFVDQGCGLEIASAGELQQALAAGCPPARILFAGPGKRDDELTLAVEQRVGEIHVESLREAQRLNRIAVARNVVMPVALRVNPSESAQGGAMRMGGTASPFGIDEESLDSVIGPLTKLPGLRISGIHMFTGTQILDADVLATQYAKAVEIARRIADRLQRPLETIDFGGGLGIPYFQHEGTLNLDAFARDFERLRVDIDSDPLLAPARLVIEPGRYLVGECGIYVSRVLDVKCSRGKTFVILDGGMNHHLAASGNLGQTIKRNFPVAVVNRLDESLDRTVEVVGPLCTPLDTLARKVKLPRVMPGDLVGILQSGAYARTASPLEFLSHASPAEVLVEGGEHRLIRHRGSPSDLLANQTWKSEPSPG